MENTVKSKIPGELAAEERYKTVPEKTKWICKDAFIEGYYANPNQFTQKDLDEARQQGYRDGYNSNNFSKNILG